MLITVFYLLKAEDYQEPCRKVQWDLNRKVSDRESTCYPTVPFSSNDDYYLLAAYLDLLSHFKFYHNFKMLMKENILKTFILGCCGYLCPLITLCCLMVFYILSVRQ